MVLSILGLARRRVPREPERESIQDAGAVRDYNRVSRWPVFFPVRRLIRDQLRKLRPTGRMVDIGCGPGYVEMLIRREFPSVELAGIDTSADMLRVAKQNLNTNGTPIDLIRGAATSLPLASSSIDFAISTLALHHFSDGRQALQEIYRILRPGGRFLIVDGRRDIHGITYLLLWISQNIFGPSEIKRTNGLVGSTWASYTPAELKGMLAEIPFARFRIRAGLMWMIAWGEK